jgi:hypothetical protein
MFITNGVIRRRANIDKGVLRIDKGVVLRGGPETHEASYWD